MSAVILPFPRVRALCRDLDRDQVLRRCRVAALVHGCSDRQVAQVERDAAALIGTGARADYVIAVATAQARGLVARDNPKDCA